MWELHQPLFCCLLLTRKALWSTFFIHITLHIKRITMDDAFIQLVIVLSAHFRVLGSEWRTLGHKRPLGVHFSPLWAVELRVMGVCTLQVSVIFVLCFFIIPLIQRTDFQGSVLMDMPWSHFQSQTLDFWKSNKHATSITHTSFEFQWTFKNMHRINPAIFFFLIQTVFRSGP